MMQCRIRRRRNLALVSSSVLLMVLMRTAYIHVYVPLAANIHVHVPLAVTAQYLNFTRSTTVKTDFESRTSDPIGKYLITRPFLLFLKIVFHLDSIYQFI